MEDTTIKMDVPERTVPLPKAKQQQIDDNIFRDKITTGDKMDAMYGAVDFTGPILNGIGNFFDTEQPGFDVADKKYDKLFQGLSPNEISAVSDVKNVSQLETQVQNIKDQKNDARIISEMNTGESILLGLTMSMMSPTALAGMAVTNQIIGTFGRMRMLRAAGTNFRPKGPTPRPGPRVKTSEAYSHATGKEVMGTSSAMAGTEFGLIEAGNRSQGDENYDNVDNSVFMGAVVGAGLSGLFVGGQHLFGGLSQAQFTEMMIRNNDAADVPVYGPAMGSTASFDARQVYVADKQATKKKALQRPLFTTNKEYTFNTEATPPNRIWETEGTNLQPIIEPKTYTTKDGKLVIRDVVSANLIAYKKPMGPRVTSKVTKKNHADAEKEVIATSREIAKNSHGKYDASNLTNDVIRDSLNQDGKTIFKTGTKSDLVFSEDKLNVVGRVAGESENINPKRFITTKEATRIAEGKGTPNDLKKLSQATKTRADELEDLWQEDFAMRGKKPKTEWADKYTITVTKGEKKTKIDIEDDININRWEEAPAEMQPNGNGEAKTIIEEFENIYIEKAKEDIKHGKGIDEKHLNENEIGGEAKDINIVRSTLSAWLGSITNTRFTGSGATILMNKAAAGKIEKGMALVVSKFVTPIYTVANKAGKNLAAKVNTTDIDFELEKVFGMNQEFKFKAYNDYLVAHKKLDHTVRGKPMSMADFDTANTTNYLKVYSRYEEILSDKMRDKMKAEKKTNDLFDIHQKRLMETETIEEVVEVEGKQSVAPKEQIKNERVRYAVENDESVVDLIDDAVLADIKKQSDGEININHIYDEDASLTQYNRDYMDADLGYYQYYQRRALENGLDKEGTWSAKMYNRQMVDKEAIDADPVFAKATFHKAVREHKAYQNAVTESIENTTAKLNAVFKGGADKDVDLAIARIAELTEETAYLRSIDYGPKISKDVSDNLAQIEKYSSFLNKRNESVGQLAQEIRQLLHEPDRIAGEIVSGAQTAQLLRDQTFDINAFKGAPSFFKRRNLSIKMDVDGIEEFMKTGSQKNLASYDYKIKGEMKVHEVFGTRDVDEFIENVKREDLKNLDVMDEKILRDMFETAKGSKQIPDDPNAWGESIARMANQFTFLAAGGGFIKYALSELNVVGAKHGYINMVREIPEAFQLVKQMYSQAQQGKLDMSSPQMRDWMAMGEVYEIYSRRMKSAFSDMSQADMIATINAPGARGSTERGLQRAQQEYYKFTGLEGATILTKLVAARTFMRRLGDQVASGKIDANDLVRWGFDEADVGKLQHQLKRVGYDGVNNKDFSFDLWSDQAYAAEIKRKINRASQDTILRNQDLHKPLFTSDGKVAPIIKTTRLFMSFQFMSQERLLMAGMTDSVSRTMSGMASTSALLGFMYMMGEVSAIASGAKKEEDAVLPWGENAGKFYRQLAIMNSYSGTWGMAGQTFGFRNLDGGVAGAKYQSSINDVSRFVGGAPAAKAIGAIPLVSEPMKEMFGEGGSMNSFSRALKQTLPFNNHWLYSEYVKHMINTSGESVSEWNDRYNED